MSSVLAAVAEGPFHDFESQRTVRAAVATRSVRGASDVHGITTFGLAFIAQEWRINNDTIKSALQAGCRLALDRSRRQPWISPTIQLQRLLEVVHDKVIFEHSEPLVKLEECELRSAWIFFSIILREGSV